MRSKYQLIVLLIFAIVCTFVLAAIFVPKLPLSLVEENCEGCSKIDTFRIAAQLGRLDIVSLVLTLLGIAMAFFAIFSFVAIRDDARTVAQRSAHRIAAEKIRKRDQEISAQIDKQIKVAVSAAMKDFERVFEREHRAPRSQGVEDVDITDRVREGDNGDSNAN